jgi:cytoskeletal protein RodZ
MTINTSSLAPDARQEFCRALKTARERKGITLDAISDTTKIPAFLFAGLERGDLRRWPTGLFRRSFFRDYARMIGVPLDEVCDRFMQLFPEPAAVVAEAAPVAVAPKRRFFLEAFKNGVRIRMPL